MGGLNLDQRWKGSNIVWWNTLVGTTPQKTTMSPENQRLEDVFAIKNSPMIVDMLVFGGVTYPPF